MFNNIARSLGKLSCDTVLFRRPRSLAAFTRFINQAFYEDYRVVLDITVKNDESHAVGMVPTRERGLYTLTSTWVPEALVGLVTTADLYPHLAPEELFNVPKRYWRDDLPFDNANITALPPPA